jgi:hypothetical protein
MRGRRRDTALPDARLHCRPGGAVGAVTNKGWPRSTIVVAMAAIWSGVLPRPTPLPESPGGWRGDDDARKPGRQRSAGVAASTVHALGARALRRYHLIEENAQLVLDSSRSIVPVLLTLECRKIE